MKLFLLTAALVSGAGAIGIGYLDSQAAPIIESARVRTYSAWCEAGEEEACRLLAIETKGQCAGPQGSGCQFNSNVTF
jgi:hypothetical protein